MDPIFTYYNNLKFADKKKFAIEFRDEDSLLGVMFTKDRDFYLTNISCFIELTNDLTSSV